MNLMCQNNSFTLFGFFDYLLSPTGLNRITNSFSDYSPSFINEVTPVGPSNAIRLEKKEEEIVLVIRPNCVIITKTTSPSNQPYHINIINEFCNVVVHLLSRIFVEEYLGNRVAIRTQCFILDRGNEIVRNIVSPVCNDIPVDMHINLNNRVKIQEDNLEENLNIVRNIDSAKATANIGDGKNKVLNALSIRTDINTVAEKNEPRFSKNNIDLILRNLARQDDILLKELSDKFAI